MQILDVVSADNNSGEVTFKVLPVNIASESFAAGGFKPMYDVGMTDGTGSYIRGYNDPDPWAPSLGLFWAEDPLDENNTLTMPVWRLEDLQAWQSRSAFAVQLRMYHFHNYLIKGKDSDDNLVFSDFEDELASPYTTLYPNVMDPITLLPGAYVTGADGNPVPVAGNYEYQYLPYDVLRQNGTSAEPGYRVILDGATPAFSIDGKIVSAKDAYHLGNLVFDTESVKAAIPADFKRLVSIVYSTNGLDFFSEPMDGAIPYLSIDYTSQVTFSGRIEIPVHVELPNPWQPALETDYTIYIVGYDSSTGTGTARTADDWVGTWSVLRGESNTPAGTYDNWTITRTADGDLRISGITGFTDSEYDVVASVNADGDMVINVQYTGVTEDKTRGELRLLLSGHYTNAEGITYYSSVAGTPILTGHLSDDGDSAYLEPQAVTSAGAPAYFNNIRFFGCYQTENGGWSAINWNGLLSPLPQTISRVK